MKNPFDILGIARPQGKLSAEKLKEAKSAYRKLVMLHHPDKGGDSEKFKEIQSAWEQIESGAYIAPNRESTMADFFRKMHTAEILPQVIINCTLAEAYRGFTTMVSINTETNNITSSISIPAKLPHGHQGVYTLSNGSKIRGIINISTGNFRINPQRINEIGVINSGNIDLTIDVEVLDLLLGAWVTVEDFLGDKFSIRVPSGFSPQQKLKARGRGYFDFDVQKDTSVADRGDLYISVNPLFTSIEKLDREKVAKLYKLTCEN